MSTTTPAAEAALLKVAQSAVKTDLDEMARRGLMEFGHQRFEYSTRIFDSYRDFGSEYLYDLVPRSLLAEHATIAEGIFRGLSARKVFEYCFTAEALEFLALHAYSPWSFWRNVGKVTSPGARSDEDPIPYSLEYVKHRVLSGDCPFGISTSPFSVAHTDSLRKLIACMGGTFVVEKLEPKLAFFLMQYGLLLHKTKPDDYREIADLVVNPMWKDWIASLSPATTPSN